MRIYEVFDEPIQSVIVSPDSRFLAAASANRRLAILDWATGIRHDEIEALGTVGQFIFAPDGTALILTEAGRLGRLDTRLSRAVERVANGPFSGAVAIAPNGKSVVATLMGNRQAAMLQQWELPGWREKDRIDYWSPFDRLVFSPNGEHIAGINRDTFELRFANSFGLNRREKASGDHLLPQRFRQGQRSEGRSRSAFATFPIHSEIVVFGWDSRFVVMETRAGHLLKRVQTPGRSFVDAVFVGTGRRLATVDGTSVMRMWSSETWEVADEYDWGCGGLTCVASSSDGLAGVCGTDTGQLVLFDVDD